ncbi:MAG: hypothetical protein BGO37_14570 [Cellulomonas sp. 73-92]|uniref:hypothetical protein n=1 Tax=Cellulomonas sp. 73-92 TaxID=1895740 RepID=UPI0009265006|nr:hypothetical protein [Cellulomonas sp. 73-92]OJV80781.1 MAG: hypothetical protein BGO37_14570 [Cellulomonas sp. 73-92]
MPDAQPPEPTRHGLDDLYDIARLADRLGVEHATIRVWLSRKVPWLPPPDGRLNGGAVWRAETLAGLEDRRQPGRPGPKPRSVVPVAPATGGIPAFPLTGGIPALPLTGGIPAVRPLTDAVPTVTDTLPVVPTPAAPPEGGD